MAPNVDERPIGVKCFGSALENEGICRFECQRGDLWHHIGTRFENNANDAERAGFLIKNQVLIKFGGGKAAAQGIRQSSHVANPCGHFLDATGDQS